MRNNKLLAAYLGIELTKSSGHNLAIIKNNTSYPCYHTWTPDTDWNQLMLVVDKIAKEENVTEIVIAGDGTNIWYYLDEDDIDEYSTDIDGRPVESIDGLGKTRIDAVCDACVKYLIEFKDQLL